MPFQIALPIALRLSGALVFLCVVIVAGALNRAVIIVPLLAGAATLVQYIAARIAPSPIAQLGAALNDTTPSVPSLNRLWISFLLGSAGYGVLFIITVFLSAMFQQTELARTLGWTDLWILLVPSAVALALSIINARISASQVSGMMDNLNSAFGQTNSNASEEPFTVEGEVIKPTDPRHN